MAAAAETFIATIPYGRTLAIPYGRSLALTRFERARILGARALQISMGAPPLVPSEGISAIDIAIRELESGLIPMTSVRVLHAGD